MTNAVQDAPEVDAVDAEEIDTDMAMGSVPDDDAPDPTDDGPDGPDAPTHEAPEPEVEDPAPLFAFKAFGQQYEVQGTRWNPAQKTLAFENDRARDRVLQMLSSGREWEARGRQELVALRKENQSIRETPHAELEQAKVYLEEWQKLMTMPVEQLGEFLMAARMEWPKMEAKAERAYAERLMEQARAAQAPPEPDTDTIVGEVQHAAAELVHDYVQGQSWATPDVVQELVEYLHDMDTMNQYVGRANRDMPEIGVRKGQYVADWDTARKKLDTLTKPYRRAQESQQSAATRMQSSQTVAGRNAAALSRAKPITPAAKPSAAPSKRPQTSPQDVVRDAMKVWNEMR